MAGILSRMGDIMKSNINAILDKCEDPSKMIDQLLIDAKSNLAAVKKETADVKALADTSERVLNKEQADVVAYTNAIKAALAQGDEAKALTMAARLSQEEAEAAQAKKVHEINLQNYENLRKMYVKLCNDVQQLEGQRTNLKGLVAATKAQQSVNKMTDSFASKGVAGKITDYGVKIQHKFDAARAYAELDADTEDEASKLLKDYTSSGASHDILARIKGEMGLTSVNLGVPGPEDPESILVRFRCAEVVTE
ncbi:phage shock protein A [Clostridia bacterium]|nr:phage shock protein A [Clostridia bacterium]